MTEQCLWKRKGLLLAFRGQEPDLVWAVSRDPQWMFDVMLAMDVERRLVANILVNQYRLIFSQRELFIEAGVLPQLPEWTDFNTELFRLITKWIENPTWLGKIRRMLRTAPFHEIPLFGPPSEASDFVLNLAHYITCTPDKNNHLSAANAYSAVLAIARAVGISSISLAQPFCEMIRSFLPVEDFTDLLNEGL